MASTSRKRPANTQLVRLTVVGIPGVDRSVVLPRDFLGGTLSGARNRVTSTLYRARSRPFCRPMAIPCLSVEPTLFPVSVRLPRHRMPSARTPLAEMPLQRAAAQGVITTALDGGPGTAHRLLTLASDPEARD